MKAQPYLFFDGCGEEAIEFYRRVLGAEAEARYYAQAENLAMAA